MKTKLIIILSITLFIVGCKKEGCIDPIAENYDKKADTDDGSCTYAVDVISEEITEDITIPTTIEAKTIKICGEITIRAEVTILAGAIFIMCENSSITIADNGSFSAEGTAENPIVIKGETETKGFWQGIAFKSNNPNNKLIHTTINDAGTYWAWEEANVFVDANAQLELSNTTIANSENIGLFVKESGSLSAFANNTFKNNITGLNLPTNQVAKLDGASNYNDNNTNDFILVRSGTIGVETSWSALTTPLLLEGISLDAGLILEKDVNLQMESDSYIDVKSTGFLKCNGSIDNPVNIKGRYTTPGYWYGIIIRSNNPNNVMTSTNIEDGGSYWAYEYSNIHVEGRLDLDKCTIKNANSWGIYVDASGSIYNNGTAQTDILDIEAANSFFDNGSGPDANCTNACTIFFK